jgi:hypothetical protein
MNYFVWGNANQGCQIYISVLKDAGVNGNLSFVQLVCIAKTQPIKQQN